MSQKVLAMTVDGEMSFCTAPEELRGVGRCNHIGHQEKGESMQEFMDRVGELIREEDHADSSRMFQAGVLSPELQDDVEEANEITQEEIDHYASLIDEIAGQHVTVENFEEIANQLSVDQIDEITRIGAKTAPMFSLPITDENFDEKIQDNRIYFANLAEYGIAGNESAINQIFGSVGEVPKVGGGTIEIKESFLEGITDDEQFHVNLVARDAQISKSVATAKPGYSARKLAYGLSDIQTFDDCGGPHIDIMHCSAPNGHICKACAYATKGGHIVDSIDRIGGYVATAASAELTTMSMKKQHIVTSEANAKGDQADIIIDTYDAFKTSPIIQEAIKETTTYGRRQKLTEGIQNAYEIAGKPVDDFLIQTITRKMTSYRTDHKLGMVPIEDPEKELADIKSLKVIGNSSNIFKRAELETSYKIFTRPQEDTVQPDAMNDILM